MKLGLMNRNALAAEKRRGTAAKFFYHIADHSADLFADERMKQRRAGNRMRRALSRQKGRPPKRALRTSPRGLPVAEFEDGTRYEMDPRGWRKLRRWL